MILYPKFYLENVKEISIEFLRKNNIKGLILDVDNTLIDINRKIIDGAEQWCDNLKKHGIRICILSYRAQKLLEIEKSEEIAVVGDQLFTDIIGANRVKMVPILVQPVDKKDLWYTKIKRPIENIFIRRYIKSTEEK